MSYVYPTFCFCIYILFLYLAQAEHTSPLILVDELTNQWGQCVQKLPLTVTTSIFVCLFYCKAANDKMWWRNLWFDRHLANSSIFCSIQTKLVTLKAQSFQLMLSLCFILISLLYALNRERHLFQEHRYA